MASRKQAAAQTGRPVGGPKGTKAGGAVMKSGKKMGAAGTKC